VANQRRRFDQHERTAQRVGSTATAVQTGCGWHDRHGGNNGCGRFDQHGRNNKRRRLDGARARPANGGTTSTGGTGAGSVTSGGGNKATGGSRPAAVPRPSKNPGRSPASGTRPDPNRCCGEKVRLFKQAGVTTS